MSATPNQKKSNQPDLYGFWGTARHNCALIDRYQINLIVSLAHGGLLSAKATEVAWTVMTGKPCPPIVYTNIGREKQKYYHEWCRANGIRGGLDETGLNRKQIDQFIGWLPNQKAWLSELKEQVEAEMGAGVRPEAILLVDEMGISRVTLMLASNLLTLLYPACKVTWSDSPHFDWRGDLAEFWLMRHHPDILERIEMDDRVGKLRLTGSQSLCRIASGTEDIDPFSLSFRPLSGENECVQFLTKYLPAEVWLSMPGEMEALVLDEVAESSRHASLAEARSLLERCNQDWIPVEEDEEDLDDESDSVEWDMEAFLTIIGQSKNEPDDDEQASQQRNLWVPVGHGFRLNAGEVQRQKDVLSVIPPEDSLFDQLCAWLMEQPEPAIGYLAWALGIGATALCLRWGTYLCVLLDETKPLDPRIAEPAASMIDDQEMKRINLEASGNLARLLVRLHTDEPATWDLLRRAYTYLPMPQRRVTRKTESCEQILGNLITFHQKHPSTPLPEYPYRTLANAITNLAYRNGPIEEIHAGKAGTYSLTHRRMTPRQAGKVMRFTAERLTGVIGACPLWNDRLSHLPPWPRRVAGLSSAFFYPRAWSLTQENAFLTWPLSAGR